MKTLLFTLVCLFVGAATAGAATFTLDTPDLTADRGTYSSLALDDAGAAHIAYMDVSLGHLMYATNAGGGWTVEVADDGGPSADVGQHCSIALDPSGVPHIGYHDLTNHTVKYASRTGGVWSSVFVELDGGDYEGLYVSLTIDGDGHPHMVYLDVNADELRYAADPGGGWTFDTVDAGDAGYGNSLQVDSSGRPHVAYYNLSLNRIDYAVRDGGVWTIETISSSVSSLARRPSLALNQYGEPHMAYGDDLLGLVYARRLDGNWVKIPAAYGAGEGYYASLALEPDGTPHISYQRQTLANDDLRYVVRLDEKWVNELVDAGADETGLFSSLALDAEGDPHIAYYNLSGGLVRYAAGEAARVRAVTPGAARVNTSVTLSIHGDHLDRPGTDLYLHHFSGDIAPTSVTVIDSTLIEADFWLGGAAIEEWGVVMANVLGGDTLTTALVVYDDPATLTRLTYSYEPDRDGALPGPGAPHDSLVYVSQRYGTDDLYVQAPGEAGYFNASRLTRMGDAANPSWSPDGSRIVFEDLSDHQLYTVDADSGLALGPELLLTSGDGDYDPAWSPLGDRIAFWRQVVDAGSIRLVNPDGTGFTTLTSPLSGQFDTDPAWSPDGSRIVFVRSPAAGPVGDMILTMSATLGEAGGLDTLITSSGAYHGSPAWSPDGKWIAFHSDLAGDNNIYLMLAAGGEKFPFLQLTDGGLDNTDPLWTPDGSGVIFTSLRSEGRDLFLADVLPFLADADGDLLPDDLDGCPLEAPALGEVDRDFDGCVDSTSSFRFVKFWSESQLPVMYQTDLAGDPRIGDGSDFAALSAGFAAWTLAPGVSLAGGDDGTRSAPSNAASGDGRNSITFSDPDGYLPGILAITPTTMVTGDTLIDGRWYRAGEIVDADILFNALQFSYSTPTYDPGPGAWDLQALATHEFGHVFGFSHSSVSPSTMFYVVPRGPEFRTLEHDDVVLARRGYHTGLIEETIRGTVVRPDGSTPVVGAAVFAVSVATGDTLQMTLTGMDGRFAFYEMLESFRIWVHPLNGQPEVNGLTAKAVNPALESVAEIDFLGEFWDIPEDNQDFGAPGYVVDVPYIHGVDPLIILNADLTGPQVVSITPAPGAIGVSTVGAILVKYDEKIALSSVGLPGALALTNLTTAAGVGGSAGLLQRDSLLVFTPNVPLDYSTSYSFTVGPPVADLFGNPMPAALTIGFETQAQPPVAIAAISPSEAPVGAALVIHGAGFSPVAADNGVTFAGAGTVLADAATPDRIFITVPAGAVTGPVTVEVNAVVSNPFSFTVLPPAVPPQAASVDDAALSGDPRKVAVKADGTHAYVATDAGVDVVDALPTSATFLALSPLAVPGGCTGVVTLPDGKRALAVGPVQPRLHVINTDPTAGPSFNTIVSDTTLADAPLGIAVVPGGAEVLIAYSDRVVMHAATAGPLFGRELRQWTAAGYGFRGDLAVAAGAGEAFATTTDGKVAVLGLLPGEGIVAEILAGTSPGEVAASPLGLSALVVDGAGSATRFASRGPLQSTLPLSGGYRGLAFSPEGSFAYAANFTLNRVDVLDLSGGGLAAAEQFSTGVDPRDVTTGSAGRYVYVITGGQDRLEVYDTQQGPRIAALSPQAGGAGTLVTLTGSGFDPVPANNLVSFCGVVLAPDSVAADGSMMLVTQPTGVFSGPVQVTVAGEVSNTRPYRVTARYDAGLLRLAPGLETGTGGTEGLLLSPSGKLLIASHPDGSLTALRADPARNDFHRPVQSLAPAATQLMLPRSMAMTPDGRKLYVVDSLHVAVFLVDENAADPLTRAGNVQDSAGDLEEGVMTLAVTGDGKRLYSAAAGPNDIFEISTAADSVIARITTLGPMSDLVIHPSGGLLFFTEPSATPVNSHRLSALDVNPASPGYRTVAASAPIPGFLPLQPALDIRPDGSRVYATTHLVAPSAPHEVHAFDADPASPDFLLLMGTIGSADLGDGPLPPRLAINHTGSVAYVVDPILQSVTAYGAGDLSLLAAGPGAAALAACSASAISLDDARLYVGGPVDSVEVVDLTTLMTLVFESGTGQTAVAGQPLPAPLVVRLVASGPVELLEGSVVKFLTTPTGGDYGFGDGQLTTAADAQGLAQAVYIASVGSVEDTILVATATDTLRAILPVVADPALVAPQVLAVAPGPANPPGVTTPIVADFSKAMDPATVSSSTYALRPAGGGGALAGYFTTANGGKRVVFQPQAPLAYAAAYEIALAAGLADTDGNPLANPGVYTFTTAVAPALALHAVDAPAARVGDPVVLSGQGFAADPSGNTILFGSVTATPFKADPGALTVKVPLGAATGPVRVVVGPDSSNTKSFVVVAPVVQPVNQEIAQVAVPTSGQQIVVVPDGSRAYMTSPGANTVVPILIAAQTSETPVPVGLHPFGVTGSPSGDRIYATNFFSNDVSVVDANPDHLATFQKVIATIPTGLHPSGVAAHPDGRTLYVANYGDSTLSVLDTDSTSAAPYSARASIPVDNSTQTVVVTPDGGRIIVGTATGLLIIDATDTSARQSITTNSSTQSVVVTPDGGFAVVLTTDGVLILIDIVPGSPTEGQARASIPTDNDSKSVAVSPDGAFVYVTTADNTVLVYQIVQVSGSAASAGEALVTSHQFVLVHEIEVGENPTGLAFDPSGSGLLLVVNSGSKTVSFINASPAPVVVQAVVDVTPNTLNLDSNGKTVTAFLQFPTFLDPARVDPASVRMEGTLLPDTTTGTVVEHNGDGILEFKIKFSRPEVFTVLTEGQRVPVTLTGLVEGQPFTATDTVRVIRPHIRWPRAGCMVPAGQPCEIRWDPIQDGPAHHVDIFWSLNDGASWDTVVVGAPDDSTYTWPVPDTFSSNCLMLVVARDRMNEVLGIGGLDDPFTVGTALGGDPTLPARFALLPAAPNPFASATRITFDLPSAEAVTLEVFAIDGSRVRVLAHRQPYPEGRHAVTWDGTDYRGARVSAGVYFLRIVAGPELAVRKLVRVQ